MAFNPGVQSRVDQYMYQGLAGMGQSIGQGISQRNQNKEARKRYGKILEGMGLDRDEIEGLSIGEMEGTVKSAAMQLAEQEMQQRMAQGQNQLEMQRYQLQGMSQQADARAAHNNMLATAGAVQSGGASPLNNESFQRYQQLLNNPQFAQDVALYQKTGQFDPEISARYAPQADPWAPSIIPAEQIGGMKGDQVFMQSPNSAQLVRERKDEPRFLEDKIYQSLVEADKEGDEFKSNFWNGVYENTIKNRAPDMNQLLLGQHMGYITKEQISEILLDYYNRNSSKGQGSKAPAAPAPKANPMTTEEFLNYR